MRERDIRWTDADVVRAESASQERNSSHGRRIPGLSCNVWHEMCLKREFIFKASAITQTLSNLIHAFHEVLLILSFSYQTHTYIVEPKTPDHQWQTGSKNSFEKMLGLRIPFPTSVLSLFSSSPIRTPKSHHPSLTHPLALTTKFTCPY